MRLIGPQVLGDYLDLRGPKGSSVSVIAPGGQHIETSATNGRATVLLDRLGVWTYQWQAGPTGSFIVEAVSEPVKPKQGRWV